MTYYSSLAAQAESELSGRDRLGLSPRLRRSGGSWPRPGHFFFGGSGPVPGAHIDVEQYTGDLRHRERADAGMQFIAGVS